MRNPNDDPQLLTTLYADYRGAVEAWESVARYLEESASALSEGFALASTDEETAAVHYRMLVRLGTVAAFVVHAAEEFIPPAKADEIQSIAKALVTYGTCNCAACREARNDAPAPGLQHLDLADLGSFLARVRVVPGQTPPEKSWPSHGGAGPSTPHVTVLPIGMEGVDAALFARAVAKGPEKMRQAFAEAIAKLAFEGTPPGQVH